MSGGPDSLALLLLASAALPGCVEAATVDHRLREGSAAEAAFVATLCASLGIPHQTLTVTWDRVPDSNLQGAARERRYGLLADWASSRGLGAVATAHHADDQAESLLMRLVRGAGVRGLAGIRPGRPLTADVDLLRPLLGWRRDELRRIVDSAGIQPVDDPSNRDDRFSRTAVRELLARSKLLEPTRLAASAANCLAADQALDWVAAEEMGRRTAWANGRVELRPEGLPPEILRRMLLLIFNEYDAREPPGPDLIRAIEAMGKGEATTLAGLKLEAGPVWTVSRAPPRRR